MLWTHILCPVCHPAVYPLRGMRRTTRSTVTWPPGWGKDEGRSGTVPYEGVWGKQNLYPNPKQVLIQKEKREGKTLSGMGCPGLELSLYPPT